MMSAVTSPVKKLFSKPEVRQAAAAAPEPAATAAAPRSAATAMDEATAARRRARRGARALLSEQRLTPEVGVGQSTLGAGPMQ